VLFAFAYCNLGFDTIPRKRRQRLGEYCFDLRPTQRWLEYLPDCGKGHSLDNMHRLWQGRIDTVAAAQVQYADKPCRVYFAA
jgi:hypothetical protein